MKGRWGAMSSLGRPRVSRTVPHLQRSTNLRCQRAESMHNASDLTNLGLVSASQLTTPPSSHASSLDSATSVGDGAGGAIVTPGLVNMNTDEVAKKLGSVDVVALAAVAVSEQGSAV